MVPAEQVPQRDLLRRFHILQYAGSPSRLLHPPIVLLQSVRAYVPSGAGKSDFETPTRISGVVRKRENGQ